MPIRVLDTIGEGDALAIAKGVRFATSRGADVINLSLEFSPEITSEDIPELLAAIGEARRRGALVVGASGNEGERAVAWPARASNVLAVGATTERGCLSEFSNEGPGLDLVAPGGGQDAQGAGEAGCRPTDPGRPIYQLTFTGSVRRFGLPGTYNGTSMAAPHVSATAALVIASRVLGNSPTPAQLERHLARTARDLGAPGYDTRYGSGLLDAAAATEPPA
jgi:serine protease